MRVVVRFLWDLLLETETDAKTRLPDSPHLLPDLSTNQLCGHLDPVLAYLLSRGANIESRQQWAENGWTVVRMDDFFYKEEIGSRFTYPPFVQWSYADPHYGDGNSLNCMICRNSLQARFDPSDPERTIGS